LTLLIGSLIVVGLLWRAGGEPLRAVTAPEVRDAPEPFSAERRTASTEEAARLKKAAKVRIGSFERPEGVPEYRILDERRDERDGVRGARLMIHTRSHSEDEYVLITRNVKAEYADVDAVSVEFVDLRGTRFYQGGALIFNTVAGADYIGYIYGPPNDEGYYVQAAE
jgi:hypothetical protein